MYHKINVLPFLLIFFLLCACSVQKTTKPIVTVTILPQKYIADQIGGDHFEIQTMVPNGSSPESYDPSPLSLVRLQNSMGYLLIGPIGFERIWMGKIRQNNPNLKFFDTSKNIQFVEGHHHHDEEEKEEEREEHAQVDPHIWTSIPNIKIIAKNTLDAFIELAPDDSAYFKNNYEQFLKTLSKTDQAIDSLMEACRDEAFVIYHPSLTYFARTYHLNQYAIESQGKEPSASTLKSLIDSVRVKNASVIFIQEEFDIKNAQLIGSELGIPVVQINPLAYDLQEELLKIAHSIHNSRNFLNHGDN